MYTFERLNERKSASKLIELVIFQPLIEIVAKNDVLRCVNLETNYLSGDFFAKLFQAALNNQSLEELKAVNQVGKCNNW